jgi:hypothetical protein
MGLLGIGDGKLELQIKNPKAISGEILEGTVTLILNKDIKAKGIIVTLFAKELLSRPTVSTKGTRTQGATVLDCYSASKTLDNEKTYTKSNNYQYNFSFVVPQAEELKPEVRGFLQSSPDSKLGKFEAAERAAGAKAYELGASTRTIKWYIKAELKHEAFLDFPIETTQEINIIVQQPTGPDRTNAL